MKMLQGLSMYFLALTAAVSIGPHLIEVHRDTVEDYFTDEINGLSCKVQLLWKPEEHRWCFPKVHDIASDFPPQEMRFTRSSLVEVSYFMLRRILRFMAILILWWLMICPGFTLMLMGMKIYKKIKRSSPADHWRHISNLHYSRPRALLTVIEKWLLTMCAGTLILFTGTAAFKYVSNLGYFGDVLWSKKSWKWSPMPWFLLRGFQGEENYEMELLPACQTALGLLRFKCLKSDVFELSSRQCCDKIQLTLRDVAMDATTLFLIIGTYLIIILTIYSGMVVLWRIMGAITGVRRFATVDYSSKRIFVDACSGTADGDFIDKFQYRDPNPSENHIETDLNLKESDL